MRIARAGNLWPVSKELPSRGRYDSCGGCRVRPRHCHSPATRVRSAPMSTNDIEIKSIRLLLVEDDPADARVVERHLKDAGLNHITCDPVQTASDAAQRLQTVNTTWCCSISGCPTPPACRRCVRYARLPTSRLSSCSPVPTTTSRDWSRCAKARRTTWKSAASMPACCHAWFPTRWNATCSTATC